MTPITVWQRFNSSKNVLNWEHNHIEFGHVSLNTKYPIGDKEQTNSWKNGKWRFYYAFLDDDSKMILWQSDRVLHAREFAKKYHTSQMYGKHPYIYHLDMMYEVVKKFGETAQIVAYLHDVIEYTTRTKEDIEKEFGKYISELVYLISDEFGRNRKERKIKTNEKLSNILKGTDEEIALICKAADRLVNMQECVKTQNKDLYLMYEKEFLNFFQAVYRIGLAGPIWIELLKLIEDNHENFGGRNIRS
jgi:(p)ppGpp synthase/HD superfamily hydrolase